MRVPLLDLSDQYRALAEPIRAELDEILKTQQFILGPKGDAIEKAICDYCAAPHAIGVSSGTDALLAVLMAMNIGAGDAVVTSAFSFFATAGCIARVGATPIFIDIEPHTYNISPPALEHYLSASCHRAEDGSLHTAQGEKVRAVIPVHLYGLCCEMDAIHQISERFQLAVIEDAAQAIGAEYSFGGRTAKAGTMGEVGCFSFYPSKNLGAAGDAGMIVCREEAFADRLRVCRQHGMEPRYYHHFIGGNFRLDEMQAAILAVKLPFLDGWSAARRAVADVYREEFNRLGLTNRVSLPAEPYRDRGLPNHHIYHQYIIRTARRDDLREHLTRKEIGTAIYYPLGLHEQDCFAYLGYRAGDFPETENAARETLALPMYPELSREAQRYVVEAIAEFFAKN
ncbi:MAG: transcriptional regulator [Chthoniobacterales bacterium]|nr:MAG: transcriptional regulator [Chthoniobacterales bacterium]